MDELVQRLSAGDHPVVLGRSGATALDIQADLEREYIALKFTDTRGGTGVGVRVDPTATDTSGADFAAGSGPLHLEGTLTLNYVRVRAVADVDLATLQGSGHLEVIEEVAP